MSTLCKVFSLCFVALMATGCNKHDPCSNSEKILLELKDNDADAQRKFTDIVCNKDEPEEIRQIGRAHV